MKVVFTVFLVTAALASASREIAQGGIGLQEAEQLKPGRTTKEETRNIFGSPAEVTDLGKLPGAQGKKDLGELWEYGKGEYTQLEIIFAHSSNDLEKWTWHVPAGNPDQDLRTAMRRYPTASWEPHTVKWINPHSYPNECYFEDAKLGVSIEYNRARKEVFTLTRYDTSRKLASEEDSEIPPKYCIAIDPDLCTPAESAKEFFKKIPISKYCEIPK